MGREESCKIQVSGFRRFQEVQKGSEGFRRVQRVSGFKFQISRGVGDRER